MGLKATSSEELSWRERLILGGFFSLLWGLVVFSLDESLVPFLEPLNLNLILQLNAGGSTSLWQALSVSLELMTLWSIATALRFVLQPALRTAARNGYTQTVTLLVWLGVDVNHADEFGYTALRYAASDGRTEMVTALVRLGRM